MPARHLALGLAAVAAFSTPAGVAIDPYVRVEAARARFLADLEWPMPGDRALLLLDTMGLPEASESARAYRTAVVALEKARRRVPSDRFIRRGMWIRPYRSDMSYGHLFEVLDHAVDWGITDLYVEDFWGGLLAEPSPSGLFPSRYPGYRLLTAYVIEAHRRGLRVHAWLHTLDFGSRYAAKHPDQLVQDGWGELSGMTEHGSHVVDPGLAPVRDTVVKLVDELSHPPLVDGVVLDYLRYPVRLKGDDIDETPDPRNFWGYNPTTFAAFFKEHPEYDTPEGHAFLASAAGGDPPPATASVATESAAAQAAELVTWKDWLAGRIQGLVRMVRDRMHGRAALSMAYFPNYYFHVNDSRLQESNRWLGLFDEIHPMCYSYYLDPNPGPFGDYTIARELSIVERGLASQPLAMKPPLLIPALTEDVPRTPMMAPFHHRIFREQVSWLRGRMLEGRFPSLHGVGFFSYGWIFRTSEAQRKADDLKLVK